jgi:hypothetical protein
MRRTHPRWKAAMEGMPAAILGAPFVMVIVMASLAFGT